MALAAGAQYIDVPNHPLGAKFNSTLTLAREHEVDAVCVMGSDDVFCERVARAYHPFLNEPTPYVGLLDLYFYVLRSRRMGYWAGYHQAHRIGEPAGCGRVIPRAYLDALDWRLWNETQNRGVDHSSFKRLADAVIPHPRLIGVRELDGCAVDLKNGDNLWTYEQVGPKDEPDASVLERLPADIREAIAAMAEVPVCAS